MAILPTALVIVMYLVLGIVAFWPVYPGISQRLFSHEADYSLSVWYLDWIPHAIAHGLNPFFSNSIFVPTGVNLAQNTESPLTRSDRRPFRAGAEPAGASQRLDAACHARLGECRVRGLAKMEGVGPCRRARWADLWLLALHGEPRTWPRGFYLCAAAAVHRARRSSLSCGAPDHLGGSGSSSAFSWWPNTSSHPRYWRRVVIFTFAALACVAISRRADLAEFGRTLLAPFGLALAVAAALLAYPVWMLLAGPHHFAGPTIGITNGFHNDLLNFGVPGPLDRVSLGMRSVGAHLNVGSDPTEGGGYIGVPLLILTGILLWLSRRSPRMQLTAVLFVGAALPLARPAFSRRRSSDRYPAALLAARPSPLCRQHSAEPDQLRSGRFSGGDDRVRVG